MKIEIDRKLPNSWILTTISEIAEYVQRGKSPKYTEWSELPVINQKCVRWDGIDSEYLKFIHPEQWEKWGEERFLQDGDVLWNSTGTGTIGRAAIYHKLPRYKRIVVDSHVTIVRSKEYNQKLLHYWIMSPAIQFKIDGMYSGSTNQVELSKTEVLSTSLPLPPLNEQKRIVAKIEALRTRSTAVKEELEAIKPLLDQFRQSVLAAAFRGDLTKDWRSQNPDVEPAEVLLERIRVERRRRWEEAELEKMKTKGKVPKDDKWKKKYKELEPIDTKGLPELPEGWHWKTVSVLVTGGIQNGIYLPQSAYGSGIPILRIDDFQDNWSRSSSELQLVNASDKEISLYSLQVGDVIINRVNSPTHLGKSLLVEERNIPALFESNMMRLRVSNNFDLKFFNLYLQSPQGRRELLSNAKWSVNQASINQTDVKNTIIPLAPLEEQKEIVRRIESLFKLADSIEQQYQQAEVDLETLNQSILAKAFRGELVPQDPNDEPASVLLERIREEREKAKPKKSKSKKKSSSNKQDKQLGIPGM